MGKQRIHRATSSPPTLLLLLSLIIIVITSDNFISTVDGVPDTTVLGRDCGSVTWAPGDPYGDLVNDLLDELATETPGATNYIYTDTTSDGTSSVYGYAQCGNTNLDPNNCGDCLNQCVTDLANNCMYAVSATITLVDCQMRYEKQS